MNRRIPAANDIHVGDQCQAWGRERGEMIDQSEFTIRLYQRTNIEIRRIGLSPKKACDSHAKQRCVALSISAYSC